MKTCPAPRCAAEISGRYFCCARHWKLLPNYTRDRLHAAYDDLKNEHASFQTVRELEYEACVRMQWDPPEHLATATVVNGTATCVCCGTVSLVAFSPDLNGAVHLDEVRNAAVKAVEKDRLLVVIGFVALPAAGHNGAYATFVEHTCPVRCRRAS